MLAKEADVAEAHTTSTGSTEEAPPIVTAEPADAAAESTNVMAERWGKDVVKLGFTYVPSVLLRGQERLGIDAVELAVLLHLLDHWWANANMPFPSKRRLAERLGVSSKTVQRAMGRLETAKLIRRVARHATTGGQTSNAYDLSPLIAQLKDIAAIMSAAREVAKAEVRRAERPGHRSKAGVTAVPAKTGDE